MKQVTLSFVLWDQPAHIVQAWRRRQEKDVGVNSCILAACVTLKDVPRRGARLQIPGWLCGKVEEASWDHAKDAGRVVVSDIFVDDGPPEQRLTDFRLLMAAAVEAGWEVRGHASRDGRAVQADSPGDRQKPPGIFQRAMSLGMSKRG